jgi:hypothetical protein
VVSEVQKLDPQDLILDCRMVSTGIPDEAPEDYPQLWDVNVTTAMVDGDVVADDVDVQVGQVVAYIIPEPERVDLLEAFSKELQDVAEMLVQRRPDLLRALEEGAGRDVMFVSTLDIAPQFRGEHIGHDVLRAVLGAIGRSVGLVVLQAKPLQIDGEPEQGSPEYEAAKAALTKYGMDFGFEVADGDYLAYVVKGATN